MASQSNLKRPLEEPATSSTSLTTKRPKISRGLYSYHKNNKELNETSVAQGYVYTADGGSFTIIWNNQKQGFIVDGGFLSRGFGARKTLFSGGGLPYAINPDLRSRFQFHGSGSESDAASTDKDSPEAQGKKSRQIPSKTAARAEEVNAFNFISEVIRSVEENCLNSIKEFVSIIISHPDEDHLCLIPYIFENSSIDIKSIILSGNPCEYHKFPAFVSFLVRCAGNNSRIFFTHVNEDLSNSFGSKLLANEYLSSNNLYFGVSKKTTFLERSFSISSSNNYIVFTKFLKIEGIDLTLKNVNFSASTVNNWYQFTNSDNNVHSLIVTALVGKRKMTLLGDSCVAQQIPVAEDCDLLVTSHHSDFKDINIPTAANSSASLNSWNAHLVFLSWSSHHCHPRPEIVLHLISSLVLKNSVETHEISVFFPIEEEVEAIKKLEKGGLKCRRKCEMNLESGPAKFICALFETNVSLFTLGMPVTLRFSETNCQIFQHSWLKKCEKFDDSETDVDDST